MYINSLPGIEFANIDQIANADEVSFAGVWANVQERAIERFRLDVIGKLSGFNQRYKLRQITQTVDLWKDLTAGITQAPSANNSGLLIELQQLTDQAICSNMQSLYVQSVSFYCVNAGAFIVTIKDATYNTTLDTFPVTGVLGWNSIKVDKQYDDVSRLSITVDTTALTTAFLDLSNFNLQQFAQTNIFANFDDGGLWLGGDCTGTAQVRGYQTDINFANPVYSSNTFGVSCIFSVKCTYNNVVCKNKRHFATAFRLCLAIELMSERIYSSRLNRWTTIDKPKAADLRREFELQYRGGQLKDEPIQYEGELIKALDSIDLDLADCCLICDANIVWKENQL
jgi:hypothetical protein